MEPTVAQLRSTVEPFLSDLAEAHYRHGAGLSAGLSLDDVYDEYPAIARAETFAMVEEELARDRHDEEGKRRLRALRELVATQVEEATARRAVQEIAKLEGHDVETPNGLMPFREAWANLGNEPAGLVRSSIERALSDFLRANAGPYARRREAAFETASMLGHPNYLALREHVTGIQIHELATAAQKLLERTEDAYRDVLGYALRKLDPGLRALPQGDAGRHDLLRLAVAPWLLEYFRPSELLPAVRRSVEELGFHPTARGRIRVDTERREHKSPRPFVASVRVPEDVRLVVQQGQGMEDYHCLLHEYGHALHLAHVSPQGKVEDRRLGDASVTEGYAFAFSHFLLEEKWLRRYLGLTAQQSKEASRIAALNELALLRRHAARLLYEVELYRRGPVPALGGEYQQMMEAALFVRVPSGFYLFDADPQLYGARYLRGWAFDALLHGLMHERFDDDYFRNPATAQWLTGLFDLGGREDADGMARLLTGAPLSLELAGQRLVRQLNR